MPPVAVFKLDQLIEMGDFHASTLDRKRRAEVATASDLIFSASKHSPPFEPGMNPSMDRIRESGRRGEELSLVGDNAMERLKSGSTFREREGGIDFDDGMVIGKGMEGLNDQTTKPGFDVYITDGPHSDPTARIKDME